MEEQDFRKTQLVMLYRSLQKNVEAHEEVMKRIDNDPAIARARAIVESAKRSVELVGDTCSAIDAEIRALAKEFYRDYEENAVSGVVASHYTRVEIPDSDKLVDFLIAEDWEYLLKRTVSIRKRQFNSDYPVILVKYPDTDLFRVVDEIKVSISGVGG